eukprot:GHVT01013524.1.p1 GENE.GHVT01013524.1~~GHVT01013524.1.p1  ORF type:complete len:102 (-),score=15.48 GHVT01013524.1:648-953(-)
MHRKKQKKGAKASKRGGTKRTAKPGPSKKDVTFASGRRRASASSAQSKESNRNITKETGTSAPASLAEASDVSNLAASQAQNSQPPPAEPLAAVEESNAPN